MTHANMLLLWSLRWSYHDFSALAFLIPFFVFVFVFLWLLFAINKTTWHHFIYLANSKASAVPNCHLPTFAIAKCLSTTTTTNTNTLRQRYIGVKFCFQLLPTRAQTAVPWLKSHQSDSYHAQTSLLLISLAHLISIPNVSDRFLSFFHSFLSLEPIWVPFGFHFGNRQKRTFLGISYPKPGVLVGWLVEMISWFITVGWGARQKTNSRLLEWIDVALGRCYRIGVG